MTGGPSASLYAVVAAGGAIGSLLRAFADLAIVAVAGADFPWGTLFVNVAGSFAIGFYAALAVSGGRWRVGTHQRNFVMTGICGGYTTFSVFSLHTLRLWQAGDPAAAAFNVGVSIAGWLAAVWLGYALAARIGRGKKR